MHVLPVIVNGASGASAAAGDALPASLTAAFAAAGVTAEILLARGDQLPAAIRDAAARLPHPARRAQNHRPGALT